MVYADQVKEGWEILKSYIAIKHISSLVEISYNERKPLSNELVQWWTLKKILSTTECWKIGPAIANKSQ